MRCSPALPSRPAGWAVLALLLAGCATEPVDLGPGPDPLPQPDLEGIDFPQALRDALTVSLSASLQPAWRGHLEALSVARPGCPDLWLGGAPELDDEELSAWADHCRTEGGLSFDGSFGWWNEALIEGDPSTLEGQLESGQRRIEGAASVADEQGVMFAWQGEAEDSLEHTRAADGYEAWRYSALLDGELRGRHSFALTGFPSESGYRADLYQSMSGPEQRRLEVRGQLYLFGDLLQDRFDSVELDLELLAAEATPPEGCALEPRGHIGLRDRDAWWFEVVFQPRYPDELGADYDNEELGACDGCGTLYVRGVESGEVCVGFDDLLEALAPPAIADFVFDTRDLLHREVPTPPDPRPLPPTPTPETP